MSDGFAGKVLAVAILGGLAFGAIKLLEKTNEKAPASTAPPPATIPATPSATMPATPSATVPATPPATTPAAPPAAPPADVDAQSLFPIEIRAKEWGYMDGTGRVVIDARFAFATDFDDDGLALAVPLGGKLLGYIDRTGAFVIPPAFQTAEFEHLDVEGLEAKNLRFHDDRAAAVGPTGRWGYIDRRGQWAILPEYVWAKPFHEGHAPVAIALPNTWTMLDREGHRVFGATTYGDVGELDEGVAPVMNANQECGYVDAKGKVVVPFKFHACRAFADGLAAVSLDPIGLAGKAVFINHDGAVTLPGPFLQVNAGFEGGLAVVHSRTGDFFIDHTGARASPPASNTLHLNELTPFQDGLASARVGRVGYLNRAGDVAIPFRYAMGQSFHHGLARVVDDKTRGWGYIDTTGTYRWGPTPFSAFHY